MNPEDIMQQQAPVMGQTPPPQMMAPPQEQAPMMPPQAVMGGQMAPPPELLKYIQAAMAQEAPVDIDQEAPVGGALGKFIKSKSLLQPGHTSYAPRVKCGGGADVTVVSVDGPKMDGSGQGMGVGQPQVPADIADGTFNTYAGD